MAISNQQRILRDLPTLARQGYSVTSPCSAKYNCIAWAAHDQERWWQPVGGMDEDYYWPEGVRADLSVAAFVEAFESLGFEPCNDTALESGMEKVAIIAGSDGRPRHVARQLADGTWTSKLGPYEDVVHALDACGDYGSVAAVLRHSRS